MSLGRNSRLSRETNIYIREEKSNHLEELELTDMLKAMWARQQEFNRLYFDPVEASEEELVSFVKEMCLGIHSELDELLSALGKWKKHRPNIGVVSRSGVIEEAVDVFKYLINIMLAFRVGPGEFYQEFNRKSKVVEDRYDWEHTLASLKPDDHVVAVDLDGVLAQYPENWLRFLQRHGYPELTMEDARGWHMFPQVPRREYYRLKHKFREEGYESLYLDPFSDAASFTWELRRRGIKIVVLSSRPYKEYKRIQVDTSMWLQQCAIEVDAFVWDSKKRDRILSQFPHLRFMVEDDRDTANELAALGYRVYLRDRPYNQGFISPGVVRVQSLLDIFAYEDGRHVAREGDVK